MERKEGVGINPESYEPKSRKSLLTALVFVLMAACTSEASAKEPEGAGNVGGRIEPTATVVPEPAATNTPVPAEAASPTPPPADTPTPLPTETSQAQETGDILKDALPNVSILGFKESEKEFLRRVVHLLLEHAPERVSRANEVLKTIRQGDLSAGRVGYRNMTIALPSEYIHLKDRNGNEWSEEIRVYAIAVWIAGHELVHGEQEAKGVFRDDPYCKDPALQKAVEHEAYAYQIAFARRLYSAIEGHLEAESFFSSSIDEWQGYVDGRVPMPTCLGPVD